MSCADSERRPTAGSFRSRKWAPGEVFQQGEVWESPRGLLWRVVGQKLVPGKALQVLLRLGDVGSTGGRVQARSWDAVGNWTVHRYQDGTLAGPGAAMPGPAAGQQADQVNSSLGTSVQR